ncbi:MAG TPA: hypothetical protein VJK52_05675, partial [Candidatus Nanoarchaeia archaeon]|nr:hypothetical protein [Candidatus Nanoarchaeia archaeon]
MPSWNQEVLMRAILFVLLLFLISCGSVASRDTPMRQEYRTGNQGLVFQFLPGTPPPRVYEGDPLIATIEVTNKGTFDVADGRLYLSGFDPA